MAATKKDSKTQQILAYIQKGWTISNATAFKLFGITRLGSVIHELRKHHDIETVMREGNGNDVRYAEYKYKGELRESETESERQTQEYISARFK